jgi:hypothetical protein
MGQVNLPRVRGGDTSDGGLRVGFVHDGYLYTTHVYRKDGRLPDQALLNATLFPRKGDPSRTRKIGVRKYDLRPVHTQYGKEVHYRWRISHGCFWGTGDDVNYINTELRRISVEELSFFDTENLEGHRLYKAKHPKDQSWYVDAVKEMAYAAFKDRYGGDPK